MKLTIFTILFLVFSINFILAECDSGQVDINEDSLSELDKLSGIGPVKSQSIIDTRPFSRVEDLIDVYGIGEVTLEKIKQQGLACVSTEEEEAEPEEQEQNEEGETKTLPDEEPIISLNEQSESIINLNSEEIEEAKPLTKTELINNNLVYAFCIFLIGLIFVILRNK